MELSQPVDFTQRTTENLSHVLATRNPAAAAEAVEAVPGGQLIQIGQASPRPVTKVNLIEPLSSLDFERPGGRYRSSRLHRSFQRAAVQGCNGKTEQPF